MSTSRETTRRQFLHAGLGGVALTVGAGGVMAMLSACASRKEAPELPEAPTSAVATPTAIVPVSLPWPYKQLEPRAAGERAYKAYYDGGCMYGTFEGIVGELRETVGAPFASFPARMMVYGKAGVVGWGTLCGALNGAAAAIYMVTEPKMGDQLISELFAWYGQSALPAFKPTAPKFEIATSVSDSPLCHVSVTRWCEATGLKALSPERAERCGQLSGTVASYTVQLLNQQAIGTFAIAHPLPAEVKECLACHGKGGVLENVHASQGVSCDQCHPALPPKHPVTRKQ